MTDSPALNVARITRLRLEGGLSQHALARALGTSQTTIRLLEEGANHDVLTLRFVARLADTLGTSPVALLDVPAASGGSRSDPGSDQTRVEATLAHAGVAVDASCLAEAFGWDLLRVQRALQRLKTSLEGTGQRLHRNVRGWAVRAREDLLSDGEAERLARSRVARTGMRRDQARLLKLGVDGGLDQAWEARASEVERILLASLLRQGLLVREKGVFRPTPELVESLKLP